MKFLRNIDIYGEPLKLHFNKNSNEATSLGGLLTILTITLGIIFSWLIGKDLYYKENPYSYQQSMVYNQSEAIKINKTNFPIWISIQDQYGVALNDDKFIKINVNYTTWEYDRDLLYFNLTYEETENCKSRVKV
jgi:hypothetical protein